MVCDRITGHVPSISSNLKWFIKAVLNTYRCTRLRVREQLHLSLTTMVEGESFEFHRVSNPSRPYLFHRDGIKVNAPENTFVSILYYANINNKLRIWENSISFAMYSERPRVMCIRIIIWSLGSKFSFKIHFCWVSLLLSPHQDIWQLITLDDCRCHLWYSAKVSKLTW